MHVYRFLLKGFFLPKVYAHLPKVVYVIRIIYDLCVILCIVSMLNELEVDIKGPLLQHTLPEINA